MRFFICGSAMTGQPDNRNLSGARLLGPAHTAPIYRLHSIKTGWHPGIYQVRTGGISILGELYDLTAEQHAKLMANEPPDMYQATIAMEDGTQAEAMLYPRELIERNAYPDISHYGGWAAYKAAAS